MRKWWQAIGERVFRSLGWVRPVKLEFSVQTKFRGRKSHFTILEWQALAQVFTACPDLEDFTQMKIEDLEFATKNFPIGPDGDRARLVSQAQREVLMMFANLAEYAAGRVDEMLKAKAPMKGHDHVYP